MNVIIFGGGISGLTTAHELIDKGYSVSLYEKDDHLGGMAHSRMENDIPSEHSWRGYAPFYRNVFDIMKRIPISQDKSVYDSLKTIEFYLLRDKIANYKPQLSLIDKIVVYYYSSKFFFANKRRQKYYRTRLVQSLNNKLSKNGYDFLVSFLLGPGYGLQPEDASLGHFYKFQTLTFFNKKEYDNTDESWYVTNKPTHLAWINPWVNLLINKGLKIYSNSKLTKLILSDDNKITGAIVNNKFVEADKYILCLNPFEAEIIFKNSNMIELYSQHTKLNQKTISNQISFRLGFSKIIKFPHKNSAFVMTDSEFNITWYPQEQLWEDIKIPLSSLWSGTLIETYKISKFFNKKAINLNREELMDDILRQILSSESLQKMIFDLNGFYLTRDDIIYKEIWYEWKYIDGKLTSDNKKFINNIYNEEFRPTQITQFDNLFIGGAHTKTSINIWSMESAVESGKLVAKLIDQNVNVYTHNDKSPKILTKIDDYLYMLYLPSIVDTFIILLLLIIIIAAFKLSKF
jgi:hypothetical protein